MLPLQESQNCTRKNMLHAFRESPQKYVPPAVKKAGSHPENLPFLCVSVSPHSQSCL